MKVARRRRIVRAATLGVALAGMAAASSATANGDVPALVRPGADLAAHVPGPENAWVDSIFIAGFVHGGGHEFGIVAHTLTFPNAPLNRLFVSVSDTSSGWYRNYAAEIPTDQYAWSTTGLQIAMPGLTWTGTKRQMQVNATTPWGSLHARL